MAVGNYRKDAKKLEEWATAQGGSGIAEFGSRDGEVEGLLKDIAERAGGKGTFHYSRFFAIGLFRLLECANASDPAVLEQVRHSNLLFAMAICYLQHDPLFSWCVDNPAHMEMTVPSTKLY